MIAIKKIKAVWDRFCGLPQERFVGLTAIVFGYCLLLLIGVVLVLFMIEIIGFVCYGG